MSKATKALEDLNDLTNMKELIEILKNIASNRFFKQLKNRVNRDYFEESLSDFLRLIKATGTDTGVLDVDNESVSIVSFTAEGGFMGSLTAKVLRETLDLAAQNKVHEFHMIGKSGVGKLTPRVDEPVIGHTGVVEDRFYEVAREIKTALMSSIKEGKIGTVYAIYPQAVSISVVKQSVVKLFPPELPETLAEVTAAQETSKILWESDPDEMLKHLAGLWIIIRIMFMLEECAIAGLAIQSQQLESSLDALKKKEKKLTLEFRKAKRSVIDASLREAFCSTLMSKEQ